MSLKVGPIRRMRITLEPWMYADPATPGPQSIILKTQIEIYGIEPFHFQEAMRLSDFESRFDYYMEHLKRRMQEIYKAGKEGKLEVESDGRVLVNGKEIGGPYV